MLTLISLLSFLLPTQLALHINSLSVTVYGFTVDYLTPTLYLTDILALLIIAWGLIKIKITKRGLIFVGLYLMFVTINLLQTPYFFITLYKWIKITEMILLGIVIFYTKKFQVFKHFIKPLSYSVFIACLLGILQFINKGSINGIFYWLGERSFVFTDPNVAPYPYAFFSHPNSFAGFLLVFVIFLLKYKREFHNKNKFDSKYFWLLLSLIFANLILTNSLNVYIAVALLVLIKIRTNSAFGLLSFDFTERFMDLTSLRFITHRLELIDASWKMIKENFWFGVGLNNFIPNLVKVSNSFINSWELQPVHNIFLLVFSEIGIIGLSVLCFIFFTGLTVSNYPLIAIFITGLNDHYWLTLQQNLLMFTYVMVISKKKNIWS